MNLKSEIDATVEKGVKSGPDAASVQAFERVVVGLTAIMCGVLLIVLVILGPLLLGMLTYETSPSGEFQIRGADVINLLFLAPLSIAGGIMHLRARPSSKFVLILTPLYLIYNGLSLGIGIEWNHPIYEGNSDQFFWLFLGLVIGGLILLLFVPPMFTAADVPPFNRKSLKVYCLAMVVFLLIFAKMWLDEILEVVNTGDTASGSYQSAPNLFWVIRYLDLGITIPLGLLGAYLLYAHPARSYPVIMLFFGFFITMILAVNSMGWTMFLMKDPEFQLESLLVFGVLGLITWLGYFYLIKHKLTHY